MRLEAPFHVFYSYSHADRRMLDRLRKHLAMLRRHGLITEWHDHAIEAGDEWRPEIERELAAADVVLLLVSADFLASDFAYEEEMLRAVARADTGDAAVVPVLLRPVDGWMTSPFGKFQATPRDARPISTWSNADEAYADVAASVRRLLETQVRAARPELVGDAAPHPARAAPVERVDELTAALHELVELNDAGEFVVVVGDADANYYVQSFAEEGSFWCEAVSNDFLDAEHALTSDQTSALAALGWNPPGPDIPNWWCVVEAESDVARLFATTLGDVYGVPLDSPLAIQRSWAP